MQSDENFILWWSLLLSDIVTASHCWGGAYCYVQVKAIAMFVYLFIYLFFLFCSRELDRDCDSTVNPV